MGAAKKGLAALNIEWDEGPHAKLSTEAIARELDQATLGSGAAPAVKSFMLPLAPAPSDWSAAQFPAL